MSFQSKVGRRVCTSVSPVAGRLNVGASMGVRKVQTVDQPL
jgi:hypothetical protein